jgi:hypothetical protein
MKSTFFYDNLDPVFWKEYSGLWNESREKSPFQSPSLLKFLSTQDNSAAFVLKDDEFFTGGVIFRKKNNTLSFLSDLKSDLNYFVFRKNISEENKIYFFTSLLDFIKSGKYSLELNNQPGIIQYMEFLREAVKKSGLSCKEIRYSVCPVLDCETPETLSKTITTSSRFRNAFSKVKKQNGAFEILTDDFELEEWTNEFCSSHIMRWEDTPTPSQYKDEDKKQFLLGCLRAWNTDKVLVRFAIKADNKRVAFVIGLLEPEAFIHHSHTILPEFQKMSPGIALIYSIGEWIKNSGLRVLDFGYGNENFKYFLANKELPVNRIFISANMM